MGIIGGLAAMFFWGIAIYLAATVSRKIGNLLTLFWMQVFGLLIGSFYFFFQFQSFDFPKLPVFLPIIAIIAILQLIAYLSFYKGMEKGQVSLVSPLGASWGLVTALLGVLVYRETLSLTHSSAVLLIIIGIILISLDLPTLLQSRKIELLSGVKEGVISMLGWGVSLFLLVYPTRNLDWFLPAFVFRLFLIILLGSYLLVSKKPFVSNSKDFPWRLLVAIGILDMGAFIGLSLGLSLANSSVVAPIASANTVITVLLARIFLRERLRLAQSGGIISIVSGIILLAA